MSAEHSAPTWWVPMVTRLHPERDRLVTVGSRLAVKLPPTGVWRSLAETDATDPDQIMAIASRFGPLTAAGRTEAGESLHDWRWLIEEALRPLTTAWTETGEVREPSLVEGAREAARDLQERILIDHGETEAVAVLASSSRERARTEKSAAPSANWRHAFAQTFPAAAEDLHTEADWAEAQAIIERFGRVAKQFSVGLKGEWTFRCRDMLAWWSLEGVRSVFHLEPMRRCRWCSVWFSLAGRRADAGFCSALHRSAFHQKRKPPTVWVEGF